LGEAQVNQPQWLSFWKRWCARALTVRYETRVDAFDRGQAARLSTLTSGFDCGRIQRSFPMNKRASYSCAGPFPRWPAWQAGEGKGRMATGKENPNVAKQK